MCIVFTITSMLHLKYNYGFIKFYLINWCNDIKSLRLKEWISASVVAILIFVGVVMSIYPFEAVMNVSEEFK